MQININTDKTIEHSPGLDEHVEGVVKDAIERFQDQITRVEAHLSKDIKHKSTDSQNRCMLEARVTGYQPIAVTDHAPTLHQAINGAAGKLKRAIDSALGRLHDKNLHETARGVADQVDGASPA